MRKKPPHDIHHWSPVPLQVGVYACADPECWIRGRRCRDGVVRAYKDQRRHDPDPTVLDGASLARIERASRARHDDE